MKKIISLSCLSVTLLVAACGGSETDPALQAPERKPMALDPNPPMSSEDIDSIVQEKTKSNDKTSN